MGSKYDFAEMAAKMSPFTTHQTDFCQAIKDADESVDSSIGGTGAIQGVLGDKLKSEWEENCAILLNFNGYFDSLTSKAVTIYNNKSEVTDEVVSDLTSQPSVADDTGTPGTGGGPVTTEDVSEGAVEVGDGTTEGIVERPELATSPVTEQRGDVE